MLGAPSLFTFCLPVRGAPGAGCRWPEHGRGVWLAAAGAGYPDPASGRDAQAFPRVGRYEPPGVCSPLCAAESLHPVAEESPLADNGCRELWYNSTGSPYMANGGQGDVLAGCIGAFVAQGTPIQAAVLGAYACGDAAARACCHAGYSPCRARKRNGSTAKMLNLLIESCGKN